jgi:probable rRNA maturation factor
VFAADEQHDHPVDLARLQRLAELVLVSEGVRGASELNLLFVDRRAIAELNKTFLDGDGPTDVLAFPLDEPGAEPGRTPDGGTPAPDRRPSETEELPLLLGDVVICPDVAAVNAPDHAGSYDDEMELLVVHGVLHVLGMDHSDPREAEEMRAREQELLASFAAVESA